MEMEFGSVVKDIYEAMDKKELRAFYQPQFDAITNRLVSAEALVRWVRTDGTIVPPAAFVPALEQSVAIRDVDWYVLEEVCIFLRNSLDAGEQIVPVSVNFSRWHIKEMGFLKKICYIVNRYHIPHGLIVVEITESALVAEAEGVGAWIDAIRAEGFSVALDDFGSGLSSLQFVKDMAIDILKIDKSLLSQNCRNDKERIVLESIFYFANRLKMTTIAEGVETEEQLGFLRTCDCKVIQGFIYSKPVDENGFRDKIRENMQEESCFDILSVQTPAGTMNLLMDAVFQKYPLVIFSNLTRNSFYMMAYENFSQTGCPASGRFDDLIVHGAGSMHPEDRDSFSKTFNRENLLRAHAAGEKVVRLVTRQIGNDGIYRRVETQDFFVKSPSSSDVLVISLCDNLE